MDRLSTALERLFALRVADRCPTPVCVHPTRCLAHDRCVLSLPLPDTREEEPA